jgi:hypothetical protein
MQRALNIVQRQSRAKELCQSQELVLSIKKNKVQEFVEPTLLHTIRSVKVPRHYPGC